MSTSLSGVERITHAFCEARAARRAALMPYLTVGYPSLEATAELVPALERAGADLVELGVPFSDPIADGPIIQDAAYRALQQGATPRACLELAGRLRGGEAGVRMPFLAMGYFGPILSWGLAAYCADCREAGIDGLIVPDLPLEEAGALDEACRAVGLALIYLIAPSTPEGRLARISARAQGFLYLVSRPGTTGPRNALPEDLPAYVARVRRHTHLPLALGFGIAGPAHARQAAELVDGVVIGSAVMQKVREGVEAAAGFVREIREGMQEA